MGSDFKFRQGLFVAIQGDQTGGQRVVVLSALIQSKSLPKFGFGFVQLLRIYKRCPEIMMSEGRIWIERDGLAKNADGFLISSR